MRTFEAQQVVELSAQNFWALKLDTSFDRFTSEAEGCTFVMVSAEQRTDEAGTPKMFCVSENYAEQSPLPTPLQTLLGTKTFRVTTHYSWWPHKWDPSHPAKFESWPNGLSHRVMMRGSSWVEPLSADRCRVVYRVEIECHVFYQALSKLLEAGLEKRLRDSYPKLAGLAEEYCAHKQSYRELLDTPATLDRMVSAITQIQTTVAGDGPASASEAADPAAAAVKPLWPLPTGASSATTNGSGLQSAGACPALAAASDARIGVLRAGFASPSRWRAGALQPVLEPTRLQDSPFVRYKAPRTPAGSHGEGSDSSEHLRLSGGENHRACPHKEALADQENSSLQGDSKHPGTLLLWTYGTGTRDDLGLHGDAKGDESPALAAGITGTPGGVKRLYTSPRTDEPGSGTPVHRADTLASVTHRSELASRTTPWPMITHVRDKC